MWWLWLTIGFTAGVVLAAIIFGVWLSRWEMWR